MHVQCSNLSFFYIFIIRVNELLLETSILLQIRCCTQSWAHSLCFSTPIASTAVQESVQGSGPSQAEHRGTLRVWLRHHMVPLTKEMGSHLCRQEGEHKVCHQWWTGCWLGHQAGGMTPGCDIHPHDLLQAYAVLQESKVEMCTQSSSSSMISLPRCWQSQPQRLGLASDLG